MANQTRVQAQLLLNDKRKLFEHLFTAADATLRSGVVQYKSDLLEVTTRLCTAMIWGEEARVFDILVVTVPIFARRRGILKYYITALLAHARLETPSNNFVLRFHNVISLELQNWLCKNGFVLDGDYFCHFNVCTLYDSLARQGDTLIIGDKA